MPEGRPRSTARRTPAQQDWQQGGVKTRLEGGSRGEGLVPDVTGMQRSRLIMGAAQAVCELGAGKATVADIVARAGVSRRTFYEIFTGYEECLLTTLEHARSQAEKQIRTAVAGEERWQERIRAGVTAGLAFLDEQPLLGRLLIVESLAAGPAALARRGRVLAGLAEAIEAGVSPRAGCPVMGEAVLGSVLAILHARMIDPKHRGSFVDMTGELVSIITLPFLGPAAARRERERPVRAPASRNRASRPLARLDVRLTYRTMRAIVAIGENPGASNRQIGQAAGMIDQGQASKLLARLQAAGVAKNTGKGGQLGATNRWELTERGEELLAAIRAGQA